jgi:leucyl aminopeptidase
VDIRFSSADPVSAKADALAVFAGTDWRDELKDLDAALGGQLLSWLASQEFEGKSHPPVTTATFGALGAPLLIVCGVGGRSAGELRKASAQVAREARQQRVSDLALHTGANGDALQGVLEHVAVGNYECDKYKLETDRKPSLSTLTVLGADETPELKATVASATVRARWQSWARDIVNAPPADLYPESLAAQAKEMLGGLPNVEIEVWDFERCKQEGCVGIVAVGQGSEKPGCLIHVRYRPANPVDHIAFVGKGVTFDAGGLSIKPSSGMQTMRCDMGGSAVVLGATGALAELGAPIAIDCFVGAVENLVDGNSYKLGDILKYRNGVTVEIHNTDAEGRLVLADCLINACQVEGVTQVIDAATLTGACVVAIGPDFTGLFTNDDDMASALQAAADADGEGLWRLPLHMPYKEMLRGEWSKIKNVGGRMAGATTAALFLSHFVTDDVRWTHLDVAGSSWRDSGSSQWAPGATGQMVRSLTSWASNLAD